MHSLKKQLVKRIKRTSNTPLPLAEWSIYSQNGEDGVVIEIIRRIFGKNVINKTFFEFGAQTGSECNCAILADMLNWSGVFIESDPESFKQLEFKYRNNNSVKTINAMVTPENIQNLIDNNIKEIDILSIDIDSHDYWVWEAIISKPKLVIIEYNVALEGKKVLKRDAPSSWDRTTAYGASIDAYIDLAKRKGYTLIHTDFNGVNAMFIRDDLKDLFEESNNPRIIREDKLHHTKTTKDIFIDL